MVTVRGCGSYLPLYRIERETIADQHGDYAGGGEVSVPAHDEGVVSLGVGAAIYLASDAASYTTGEIVTVDDGFIAATFDE
jgi:3-hydroxy-3-methylglutaryl CoA synthase